MALVVGHSIRKRELGDEISAAVTEILIRSANVALARPIKGKNLPKGTKLLKFYATSSEGPRRIVYLLEVDSGDLFLLFYRSKNDEVGGNASIKNKAFRIQLEKSLDLLIEDIERGDFDLIDLAIDGSE